MTPTILQILQDNRVDYREHGDHPHVTEGFVGTDCPLCTPNGGHFRLGFSLYGSGCSCWSCSKQSAGEMLSMLIGKPAKVCWAMLLRGNDQFRTFSKKPRGRLKLPNGTGPLLPAHKAYLKKRGFDPDEMVDIYGLMGTDARSSRPWSLVFPVKQDWETVSFFTRKLHDRGGRYLNAEPQNEAVSAKELLYAEDFAVNAVCVCEGAFDAMRVGPGAVATMGLVVSTEQVRRLARYHRIVVCMDSDPDAQKRAMVLCARLSVFGKEVVNLELSSKDAAEATESEIKEIRKLLR